MSECECGGEFEFLPCRCGAMHVPKRRKQQQQETRYEEYVREIAAGLVATDRSTFATRNDRLSNSWDMQRMRERMIALAEAEVDASAERSAAA